MSFGLIDLISKSGPAASDTAVATRARTHTYAGLEDTARCLATGLADAGVRPGDRVLVHLHNGVAWFEIFFAAATLGAQVVPANHLLSPTELGRLVTASCARLVLTQDSLLHNCEGLEPHGPVVVSVDSPAYEQLCATTARDLSPADPTAPFLLQYTSGTTGRPKGVVHSQSTILWNAALQREPFQINAETRHLVIPALSWIAGFHSLCLQTLWSGGFVTPNATDAPLTPQGLMGEVSHHRINTLAMVPTVLRRLVAAPVGETDVSHLRLIVVGGEPVSEDLIDKARAALPSTRIVQVYGMSEFPSLATFLPESEAKDHPGSAGRATPGTQLRVIDTDGAPVASGEVGEVCIKSPAVFLGYLDDQEATDDAIRDGWYRTGDLGHLDDAQYLTIVGRKKDLVISGGLNVYPAEVEEILLARPDVSEVAVFGLPDETWGEKLVAVVVPSDGATITAAELDRHCSGQLARYKVPKAWAVTRDRLPRTASGKVQKHLLDFVAYGGQERCS